MAVEVDRITVDAMTGADWPGRERLGKQRGVWRDVLLVGRRSGAIE